MGPIPRIITNDSARSVRMSFKDILAVSTGAGGTAAPTFSLGVVSSAINPMGALIPRLQTLSTMYRQFYLNKLTISWIPCASTSSAGTVAIGVDQAVTAVAPTTHSNVYRHVPAVLSDIKAPMRIVWDSRMALKNDAKYTTLLAGIDEDGLSYGVFQCYATGPVSTPIGVLEIICDVTFTGPC